MINIKKKSRRTPIDASYSSCESTYVEFLVYVDKDSAQAVSNILQLEPTKSQTKGDLIVNSRGIERLAKTTYWILSSEGKILSKDIRHHLDWLLNQLLDKQFQLSRLQSNTNMSMTVNCIWWSTGSGGPTLWPEQMKMLSQLNLECTFDIYFE